VKISKAKMEQYFVYLDNLRSSGVTNMWGCGLYLERAFTMSRQDTGKVSGLWMKTFDDRPVEERVAEALEKHAAAVKHSQEKI
jgi:hypothetical protein